MEDLVTVLSIFVEIPHLLIKRMAEASQESCLFARLGHMDEGAREAARRRRSQRMEEAAPYHTACFRGREIIGQDSCLAAMATESQRKTYNGIMNTFGLV